MFHHKTTSRKKFSLSTGNHPHYNTKPKIIARNKYAEGTGVERSYKEVGAPETGIIAIASPDALERTPQIQYLDWSSSAHQTAP